MFQVVKEVVIAHIEDSDNGEYTQVEAAMLAIARNVEGTGEDGTFRFPVSLRGDMEFVAAVNIELEQVNPAAKTATKKGARR